MAITASGPDLFFASPLGFCLSAPAALIRDLPRPTAFILSKSPFLATTGRVSTFRSAITELRIVTAASAARHGRRRGHARPHRRPKREQNIGDCVLWFYTPMMLRLADSLEPKCIVYDCMDELSMFKNAPPELMPREQRLFRAADLVFTGGQSLYEAKRDKHPRSTHFRPASTSSILSRR